MPQKLVQLHKVNLTAQQTQVQQSGKADIQAVQLNYVQIIQQQELRQVIGIYRQLTN